MQKVINIFFCLQMICLFLTLPVVQAREKIGHALVDSTKKYYLEITHIKRNKIIQIQKGKRVSVDCFGTKVKGKITDIQKDFIEINRKGQKIKIPIDEIDRVQRLSWGIKIARGISDFLRFFILPVVTLLALFFIIASGLIEAEGFLIVIPILALYFSVVFAFLSLPYIIQKRRFSKKYNWNIAIKEK